MKRYIATLLTLTMVLSLAGCGKKDDSKKSKVKFSVPSTEDTTSSETSTVATTSETTVETTTESTTETTPAPTTPSDPHGPIPALYHELVTLNLDLTTEEHFFCEKPEDQPENETFCVQTYCDYVTVSTTGLAELNDFLDEVYMRLKYDCETTYENMLYKKNTGVITKRNFNDMFFAYTTTIYRADSRFLSFAVTNTFYNVSDDWYYSSESSTYVMDTATAKYIDLFDVITDPSAFANEMRAQAANLQFPVYSGPEGQERERNAILAAADTIANGDYVVGFLLTNNCIMLQCPDLIQDDMSTTYVFSLNVLDLGGCVDLTYFNETTPCYTLTADRNNVIKWDLYDDGVLDTFAIESPVMGFDTFAIKWNGTTCDIPELPNYLSSEDDDLVSFFIAHAADGDYLYLEFAPAEGEPVNYTLACKIENGGLSLIPDYFGEFEAIPYDLSDCHILKRNDLLGTGTISCPVSIENSNGTPVDTSSYCVKKGNFQGITAHDMTVEIWAEDGSGTVGSLKVSGGTPVRLLGIDTEKNLAYFCTLNEDDTLNEYFQMQCESDDYGSYDITFEGESAYTLFTNCTYYD